MKAGWLVGGFVTALAVFGWSAWGDTRGWLINNNAAQPSTTNDYGRAVVEFAQVAVNVEIPLTDELKAKGLGGRTTLSENTGMLFQYPEPDTYPFWMKGMKMPLDIIWIVDNRIVDITAKIPAPRVGDVSLPVYRPNQPVTDILEVRAGFAAKYGLKVGDVVRIDRR